MACVVYGARPRDPSAPARYSTGMKLIEQSLLDTLAASASSAPRGRAHHNVHANATDPVQRFFVVADQRSYFRPHRHLVRSELALIVRGAVDVLTFDDEGTVTGRWSAGEGQGAVAYETPQHVWHTVLVRRDGTAFFEVKEGPYDPATAVDFAPWAPPEGDAAVAQYQHPETALRAPDRKLSAWACGT